MNTLKVKESARRCPACHQPPEVNMEQKMFARYGEDFVLRCRTHGHMSIGDTLESAIKHWNHYIAFIIREAGEHLLNKGTSKADESYCTVCADYTKNEDLPEKIECAVCHTLKCWKNKPNIAVAVIALLFLCASVSSAWSTRNNPDRYPSLGMDVSTGKLAGMLTDNPDKAPQTDGGFVKGALDIRVPVTDCLTMHAFGSSTGINNNLQFSEGHEIGLGLRVYFQR